MKQSNKMAPAMQQSSTRGGKCPYGQLACKECRLWLADFRLLKLDPATGQIAIEKDEKTGQVVFEDGNPKPIVLQEGECSIVATAKYTQDILNRIAALRVQAQGQQITGPARPGLFLPGGRPN